MYGNASEPSRKIPVCRISRRRNVNSAAAGFDALDRTVHLYRPVDCQARGEARPDPKCVGGLDEHAVRTDVAGLPAQNRGAPLNLKLGAKGIARRPAALEVPRRMLPTGHRPEPTPRKDPKPRRRGVHAASMGKNTATPFLRGLIRSKPFRFRNPATSL